MQHISNIPAICSLFNIEKAIISPGSRNAPLIFAFSKSKIECISIVDERSAAYFALGVIQKTQKPVAIVCTSGTAVLNYAPAIAEAYYQQLPLLIFTADRPPELIDQNDGQTIHQNEIYKNYCKASYTISEHAEITIQDKIVYSGIRKSLFNPQGPIHFNVPLSEPLYNNLPKPNPTPGKLKIVQKVPLKNLKQWYHIKSKWQEYGKKMILCGFHPFPEYNVILEYLSRRDDTIVVAENISNCNVSKAICTPDSFFSVANSKHAPEILITIGNSIVSKKLKQFLRTNEIKEHWHIHETTLEIDTFKKLTQIVRCSPVSFLEAIDDLTIAKSSYNKDLLKLYESVHLKTEKFIENCSYSDLKVMSYILKNIPENSSLHLSNSTPIRYSQLFHTNNSVKYFSNRGTSGIDGCVSTAAGTAFVSEETTTVITGDISFLYDSNALWINHLPSLNLKIILINNGGGNIFKLIQSSEQFNDAETFFTTPHNVNIKQLVKAYKISYLSAENLTELEKSIKELYSNKKTTVLEIKTDLQENIKNYKDYFLSLK